MLHNIRQFVTSVATASGLMLALAACQPATTSNPTPAAPPVAANKPGSPELEWARAALERNPTLKVISIDTKNNSIKVQVRASDETFNVSPGELAAIPIADLVALTQAPAQAPPASPPRLQADIAGPNATAAATPNEPSTATPQYTVKREDGRVRISGPGVAIESQPNKTASAATTKTAKDEPLICEGRRMLHLDGRQLHVDGDAITVRGGCELHLTNSIINATGVGINVDNGSIHIANSTVQGEIASLQMEARAKVYIRNSQFIGISRRDDAAELQDMGGNRWQTSASAH